jgi:hypothetical protein
LVTCGRVFEPGYYKTNMRALRLREVARFNRHGWVNFPKIYWITRFKKSNGGAWMPNTWNEMACAPEDFSESFWKATASNREALAELGFIEYGPHRTEKKLLPVIHESGSILHLDKDRCYEAGIIYVRGNTPHPVNLKFEKVTVWFMAYFGRGVIGCSNQIRDVFDPPPNHDIIRVATNDPKQLYQKFLDHLRTRTEKPRHFHDDVAHHEAFDARCRASFEDKVRRRLYIRMTDAEVEVARKNFKTPPLIDPTTRRRSPYGWIRALLILGACIAGVTVLKHVRAPKVEDTMEYRGQRFKMAKAYESYEDYKDDPQNLEVNELPRIERAMTEAKIPPSFSDRTNFIDFMITDLEFPGYGEGEIGDGLKADDGSKLLAAFVEIPQRDKSRYLVIRSTGGPYKLVDDFIYSSETNSIATVNLAGKILRYTNDAGELVREHNVE